ncbi:ACP synthase [Paraburkholderia bryophila]|uniref:ACP synthase n=1 Tax=Paraburkholderia bryophila TaxID=420952 RepID=UPI0038BA06EF
MKRPAQYSRPTTYAEIVRNAHVQHAGRIAELKRAEKIIRAIEPDLEQLNKAGIGYDVGVNSMRIVDVSAASSASRRAKWALHVAAGIFSVSENRLTAGFIALGWIVESGCVNGSYGSVVLRKPKTQTRVRLDGNVEYLCTILPKGAE